MRNEISTRIAGRDVRPGHVIQLDSGVRKEVWDVVCCNGTDAELKLIGGTAFRTAAAIQFKYTDGTSQYAHPSTKVEVIAATPISEPSSLR